ncbi:MAG: DNA polymerase III subunit gamma/tau, partial [Alteromonadales bacterium]|nr:DNA polymerase III subunit gamma/tau [Alteromonadales bacterium]
SDYFSEQQSDYQAPPVQVQTEPSPVTQVGNEPRESGEQVRQPPINNEIKPLAIDSPVSSVLATRNMLRSRKKELEKQAKKPSDAALRQTNNVANNIKTSTKQNTEQDTEQSINKNEQQQAEVLAMAPEPEVPFHQDSIDPAVVTKANQVDKWAHMIDSMQLTARIRQLAIHATISEHSTDDNLILQLNQATRHLNTQVAQQNLQDSICQFLSKQITVTLNIVDETVADPYQIQGQINDKRLEYAKILLKEDPVVIALQETFQASLDENSISPR